MIVFMAGFAIGSITGVMVLTVFALAAAKENDEQDN